VRIFLSTPSDVATERTQVATLVRDVNETVQFLAPTQDVRVELVHYETHAFPDVGTPQAVIDDQIPVDYDLYLGIMWKRAGTPTSDAPSGTIHEFDRALEHRRRHGWPVIMFFFCDEQIDFPQSSDDILQLERVLEFRKRLAGIGLTVTYPRRDGFRDALRPRLLRGLADILFAAKRDEVRDDGGRPVVAPEAELRLRALASRYEEVRRTVPSGRDRTRQMTELFNAMVELASAVRPLVDDLEASASAWERLAAIAVLHAFPDGRHVDWLAARLDNPRVETPFVGYQAAVALGQAARSLPPADQPAVRAALERALELARKLPSDPDRIRAVEHALQESIGRAARTPSAGRTG
jgi:hypothetical protein